MSSTGHTYVPNESLGRIVGFPLYSVQFVLDYVRMRVGGAGGRRAMAGARPPMRRSARLTV